MAREPGERIIRCLHVDFDRPPHETDAYECHWRCTATFQCYEGEMPYCPYHRPIYTHSGRVTREDMQRAQHAIDRDQRHVTQTIPDGRGVSPARDDLLTDEDLERLRLHRAEQLARARAADLTEEEDRRHGNQLPHV